MVRERLAAIDQFRGFAILGMVLANFASPKTCVPAWLKHAPDIGLTVTDLIAPAFVFAMGLTFGAAVRRHAASDGWAVTVGRVLRRNLALIGIGCVFGAGEILAMNDGAGFNWGVLQALGGAGILTLCVIRLPWWGRLVVGAGLLAFYQVMLDRLWLSEVLAAPHGGFQGTLAWGAQLILSTVVADAFFGRYRKYFPLVALAVLAVGIALAFGVPVSKNRVSASYVIVSLGASGVIFAAFHVLVDRYLRPLPLLSAWGRNPLLLYVIHQFLLAFFVLPVAPWWTDGASPELVLVQTLLLVSALHILARSLDGRGITISL